MNEAQLYGYMRVSTKEQNEDRQLYSLLQFGVKRQDIFLDKQSGKDLNRPAYQKLVKKLKPGDTLVIKSIDRLGRNYEEILDQWRVITKNKNATIVVLDMPLLDTREKNPDLIGTFITDLVLQILSYVAQTERELIRQRQKEGIAAAQARGVRFGRPQTQRPPEFFAMLQLWQQKKISAREAARRLHIDHTTFLKWSKKSNCGEIK